MQSVKKNYDTQDRAHNILFSYSFDVLQFGTLDSGFVAITTFYVRTKFFYLFRIRFEAQLDKYYIILS